MASSDTGGSLGAILDVGKTHSRLVVVDPDGEQLVAYQRRSSASATPQGYLALDSHALGEWLLETLDGLGALKPRLRSIVPIAHGAAIAPMRGDDLLLPIPDYEFEGFDAASATLAQTATAAFGSTLSPALPRGLNVATQLAWLEENLGATMARCDRLLPYAQYWAHWLSGVAAAEVSSLGCHTHLWNAASGGPSELATQRGWADRLPALRRAWEPLGRMRPDLARRLGLPADLAVHCGAHDSNACLARYLRTWPRATLVSSGTWAVLMAPGASPRGLDARRDMLGNVSVRGDVVPTARFMAGREFKTLCDGASPSDASMEAIDRLLAQDVMALPSFETQGGPFGSLAGVVLRNGRALPAGPLAAQLPPDERAALAALYCADVTAWLLKRLNAAGPVILEGPFASNPVLCQALAALLPEDALLASVDDIEGTVRGGWCLTRWTDPTPTAPRVRTVGAGSRAAALRARHARWLAATQARGAGVDAIFERASAVPS